MLARERRSRTRTARRDDAGEESGPVPLVLANFGDGCEGRMDAATDALAVGHRGDRGGDVAVPAVRRRGDGRAEAPELFMRQDRGLHLRRAPPGAVHLGRRQLIREITNVQITHNAHLDQTDRKIP